MVRTLLLGLLVATICGIAVGSPAAGSVPEGQPFRPDPGQERQEEEDDPGARSERSTNLTGTARKIQMFIKNKHLQILPDGTVNGTTDDTSAYSILQRTTVGIGRMKIQGLATCQYLCMSRCGLLYGSRDFGDECVFNETIEQSNYNTYSSCKYSNDKRTFYLALNQGGQPRKVMLRARRQLGKLSSYILVLTKNFSPDAHAQAHPIRHHAHGCPPAAARAAQQRPPSHPQHCPRRRKRKKKRRKCDDSDPGSCPKRLNVAMKHKSQSRNNVKCASDMNGELCQRDVDKKRKTNVGVSEPKRKKKNRKGVKKRLNAVETAEMVTTTTTTMSPTSTLTVDYGTTVDEDYAVDTSTHADWDDAKNTISPLADSD
ncbi:unnamed protein product [Phaedon cochleariae]|uniref:Fibroblast growth factor n=1 Tax=Phaedon cochleariae TaxID=80249 RepID=A0A9P0DFU3_PHACE|nr:unnamed protein product [Phaedon cochleariae]